MAIQTKTISTMVDDVSGLVATISVSYDDAALRLTEFRVNNPTSRAILGTLVRQANGRVYSTTFPAGQETFIPIPANPPADRIGVTIDAQGRINGAEYSFAWVL